jgi:NADH-quinone oxidoreductase subunit A
MHIPPAVLPIFLFLACVVGLAAVLFLIAAVFNPLRSGRVKQMPYESGMDPVHDTRRRFDVRFHLLAIAFLVFDVELLFLYPWAVATRPAAAQPAVAAQSSQTTPAVRSTASGIDLAVERGAIESRDLVFGGAMVFIGLLAVGFIYDWRKGIFRWR